MLVRSEKGLAEVQLYERGTLIRRFLLDGAKEFKRSLDEYHYQQRSFLLVAVDTAGGRAVSWARNTCVQECWFGMCSDNMNDMGPGGKITLDTERVQLGGTECIVTPSRSRLHVALAQLCKPGWPTERRCKNPGYRAGMKDCSLVSRFGMVLNYPLGYYYDGPGLWAAFIPCR